MMSEFPFYKTIKPRLNLAEKVGQLFMPAAFINDSEAEIENLESLIARGQAGGLCFFHSRASAATNFEGPKQIPYNENSLGRLQQLIERYQGSAPYPLLMAIDAEWGLAMRVERAPQYPYALTLGALNPSSENLIYELGLRLARDCREIGIHLNLAPVVDINTDPGNPVIGYRAFGSDPEAVSRKATLLHKGLADGGILSCAKHFPGHGDTAVDSHLNLPVIDKGLSELAKEELLPFRTLIEASVPVVMTGHLSLPRLDPSGLPASLSEPIIRILRDMKFEGAIITDALNMHALKGVSAQPETLNLRAIAAGNDILCYAERVPESLELILNKVSRPRIEASFKRVWDLKSQAFRDTAEVITSKNSPAALNRLLARECLTELGNASGANTTFRKEGFEMIAVGQTPEQFVKTLRETHDFKTHTCFSGVGVPTGPEVRSQNVLISLCPPQMKAKGFFGLPPKLPSELEAISAEKNIILYLFGNPYVLTKLPLHLFSGVVCAFQSEDVFQETAGEHFLGRIQAKGEIPINLVYGI